MQDKFNQLQAKIEEEQGFTEKLFAFEKAEDVQTFLKGHGLDFSLEEINLFKDALVKTLEKGTDAELSDEDLEDVAGGVIATTTIVSLTAAAIGGTCGGGTFIHNITRGRW